MTRDRERRLRLWVVRGGVGGRAGTVDAARRMGGLLVGMDDGTSAGAGAAGGASAGSGLTAARTLGIVWEQKAASASCWIRSEVKVMVVRRRKGKGAKARLSENWMVGRNRPDHNCSLEQCASAMSGCTNTPQQPLALDAVSLRESRLLGKLTGAISRFKLDLTP